MFVIHLPWTKTRVSNYFPLSNVGRHSALSLRPISLHGRDDCFEAERAGQCGQRRRRRLQRHKTAEILLLQEKEEAKCRTISSNPLPTPPTMSRVLCYVMCPCKPSALRGLLTERSSEIIMKTCALPQRPVNSAPPYTRLASLNGRPPAGEGVAAAAALQYQNH